MGLLRPTTIRSQLRPTTAVVRATARAGAVLGGGASSGEADVTPARWSAPSSSTARSMPRETGSAVPCLRPLALLETLGELEHSRAEAEGSLHRSSATEGFALAHTGSHGEAATS